MLYIRLCLDKPGTTELRDRIRDEHRAYLKPMVTPGGLVHIVQAGPLCVSDTDDTNLASFLIVEAASEADVLRFHENDPFTKAGIYGTSYVHRWDKHIG